METRIVVVVTVKDEEQIYFDSDDMDNICDTLNSVLYSAFIDENGNKLQLLQANNFSVSIRPLSEIISC